MNKDLWWKFYILEIDYNLTNRSITRFRQSILLGCSGGQDSSSLLSIFWILQISWEWFIGMLHCNHNWTISAFEISTHLGRLCYGLSIPFYITVTPIQFQQELGARIWRGRTYQRVCIFHEYESIALAHTLQDLLENLFFNFICSYDSLNSHSMSWVRGIEIPRTQRYMDLSVATLPILRPCLGVERSKLRSYGQILYTPLWPDQTNFDFEILRNRIRYELFPYLRNYSYVPINQSLKSFWEVSNYKEQEFDDFLRDTSYSYLSIKNLSRIPWGLQKQVVVQFLRRGTRYIGARITLSNQQIEQICESYQTPGQWVWLARRIGVLITDEYLEINFT